MARSCTRCGCLEFDYEQAEQTKVVSGVALTADLLMHKCTKCKLLRVEPEAQAEFEKLILRKVAAEGPVSGESFRMFRKCLGLTGAELGLLLDVAGETISRWERGDRSMYFAAWMVVSGLALATLEGEGAGKMALEQIRKVRKL